MTDHPTPAGGDPAAPADNGRRYWIDDDGNVKGVVFTDVVDYFVRVTPDGQVTYFPHKPGEPPAADQPAA